MIKEYQEISDRTAIGNLTLDSITEGEETNEDKSTEGKNSTKE